MRVKSMAIAAVAASVSASALASTNLVLNGSFDLPGGSKTIFIRNKNPKNPNAIPDWTVSGVGLVHGTPINPVAAWLPSAALADGTSKKTGAFNLWGPHNGSNNGLIASPDGGAFVALDGGAQYVTELSQTVTGLHVGDTYALSFYWAGAQQYSYTGKTTEAIDVYLGTSQVFASPVLHNASHGFTGWQSVSLDFKAASASDILAFIAMGTPSGFPPFTLLDGVSITDQTKVSEPGPVGGLALGLLGLTALRRRARGR